MGTKLTATLTAAALLGAGIYGGNLAGEWVNQGTAEVLSTAASDQTGINGGAPSIADYEGTRSTGSEDTSAPAGETIDEVYNRVRAERATQEEIDDRAYVSSGVLPELSDPRYGAVVAENAKDIPYADKDNFPNNPWLTWDKVAPGMAMGLTRSEGGTSSCTLGFIAQHSDGTYYGLSAGHCMQGSGAEVSWKRAGSASLEPLGEFTAGQVRDGSLSDNAPFVTDYAAIKIGKGIPGDMNVGLRYTVTDVYSADDLSVGMEVCKLGFRTEETCGEVVAKNGSMVRANLFSLGGDSGAPAYVKLGDNKIAAVGLLTGSPELNGTVVDSLTDFALIDPIIRHTNLDLMPYMD